MSGTHLAPWALSRRPRVASRRLSEHLGCGYVSGSSYLLGCLERKDVDQIVKAVERLVEVGQRLFLSLFKVSRFLFLVLSAFQHYLTFFRLVQG